MWPDQIRKWEKPVAAIRFRPSSTPSVAAIGCALAMATIAAGLATAPAIAQPTRSLASRCDALAGLRITGMEITSTKRAAPIPARTIAMPSRGPNDFIEAAFPAHCRVEGMINRRKGAGGTEYGIGFALALPDDWNGRFLFQGGGGFNGTVADPYGLTAAGDEPALTRGFAVVSTDSGHEGAVFETAFLRDQQAALDFAFNAVPAVTAAAQELVARYYGRPAHHSYAVGCSTGGREGMIAAQRHPDLFDGIVAGDPAMRSGNTRVAGWNATVAFNRIAPTDAAGRLLRAQSLIAEDHQRLYSAVAGQCDALDGLSDGLILNQAACDFDPEVLQCASGASAGCLSAEKVAAIIAAFTGPSDSRGNSVYPGFSYDLGLLGGRVPMTLIPGTGYTPYIDPPEPLALDVDAEAERLRHDPVQILSDTFEWTDLGSFYRRGGKILFYHGAADPW
jgi:pimeloyl-ACP methyl ester carboxylesterase